MCYMQEEEMCLLLLKVKKFFKTFLSFLLNFRTNFCDT